MKKQIPALIAAFLITGFIAFAMGVTGVNALINKKGTVVSNDPSAVSSAASEDFSQAQIEQLQARINEYQQSEAQYQQMLNQDQQQLHNTNSFCSPCSKLGSSKSVVTGRF